MGRPIVLSNGELHVGLNEFGLVHDFYFPYVGLENHSAGHDLRHKIGVWIEGTISWIDDGSWDIQSTTADGALIGHTRATHQTLGIILELTDTVATDFSALLRSIHVINTTDSERHIRLFTHQAFAIGDSRSQTDTAQYLPDSDAVLHYRGRRAFVIGGSHPDGRPFDQHSIGIFGSEGKEGTYRDADDGELSGSNVEHGRVDSTLRFSLSIEAFGSTRVGYWVAAGTSIRQSLYVHKLIQDHGVGGFIHASAVWWHTWLEPARTKSDRLPSHLRSIFTHSALVVKAHIDKRGAVIASTDTTMLNYSRDAYAYCWPRDAAYALWPLIRLGYTDEPRRFFDFARRGLHQNGYLSHKYQADGALGSSWHSYVHDSQSAPPIQEDETALTLFLFGQFYQVQQDPRLLQHFYDDFVKKMASFLVDYIDPASGLPKPSYDLWEERYITSTYTTAVVYAALQVAADLAEAAGDPDNAVSWRSAADDLHRAANKRLFNTHRGYFFKGIERDGSVDETIDVSAFYGAYMFGLFSVNGEEITTAFSTLQKTFLHQDTFGVPRYEHDDYHATEGTGLGNYWFIASFWMAQYAHEIKDETLKNNIIDWTLSQLSENKMFSEQLHPESMQPLSVSPLVWSHAEFLTTMLDIIDGDDT